MTKHPWTKTGADIAKADGKEKLYESAFEIWMDNGATAYLFQAAWDSLDWSAETPTHPWADAERQLSTMTEQALLDFCSGGHENSRAKASECPAADAWLDWLFEHLFV